MTTNLIILIILLILSAFFSATEVAFLSLSDVKVDTMVKRKMKRARLIQKLKSNPRRLLITILIGNNVVNIASASLATVVMSDIFKSAAIGITTGVMTLLVLVFGEIIPKSYANNHNKKFAIFSVPVIRLLQIILFPFVLIFEWLTRIFAGEETEEKIHEEELKAMAFAAARQGNIEKKESAMMERLFQFNDITAEDIMTPRVNIVYLKDTMTVNQAIKAIEKHPHTRFPIAEETPDKIIGFVHSRDILLALHRGKKDQKLKNIIHPIIMVPKQMIIDNLLMKFQKRQTHMAVVLDEFGGTEGVVTLEDVVEELVGEISDEHDVSQNVMKRIDKKTILVTGEEDLRDITSFLNTKIEGNPLDTIAEIILDEIKTTPRKNMTIELEYVVCTILKVKKGTIKLVKIAKK
jgi:putative hemolysin